MSHTEASSAPGAQGVGVACSPSTLTANAFGVTDLPTADGIVVLLVAHQCVHAQDGW